MANRRSRILILFCGGTISSHKDVATGALQVTHGVEQILGLDPRLQELADISHKTIASIDSTDADRRLWELLATEIAHSYDDFDGFVVTMGTNTLAYCSSALAFALQDIGKPVIITGAQIPAEAFNSDARNNVVNAIRVANMDIAGVYVVFGSRIILGARAKKVSESELDAFKSFNTREAGEIGVGTVFYTDVPKRHSQPPNIVASFEDSICCVTLVPGLSSRSLIALLDAGAKGLVLRAFGSGDVPERLFDALTEARRRKVPVVVTTQCPGGATILGINEPGLRALELGVIEAFDMSMEAMTTKLMWLLSQGVPYEELKQRMQQNLVGECDSRKSQLIRNTSAG